MRQLIPQPSRCVPAEGSLQVGRGDVRYEGPEQARLRRVGSVLLEGLRRITGDPTASVEVVLSCDRESPVHPPPGMDESYTLDVSAVSARIHGGTVYGVLRGTQTFLQLAGQDSDGWAVPACRIEDAPRYAWRGLLLDVVRHPMPLPLVHRTLDGMAMAKLNVLHLHLTDDQAFRFESVTHPALHSANPDGLWYSQDDLRELVDHASASGIRVVPELDMPGHTTSWLVAMPELGPSGEAPEPRRRFGIAECALDPEADRTFEVVADLVREIAGVFPDAFVHVGGDEVSSDAWAGDREALQASFNRRIASILDGCGRRMIGWDEILHPDLPESSAIQSWRSPMSMWQAAREGRRVVLSHPWYLDHMYPARLLHVYEPRATPDEMAAANAFVREDPGTAPVVHLVAGWQALFGDVASAEPLPDAAQELLFGGEACMWSEHVTAENLAIRLWPRLGAFAEALWSGAGTASETLEDRLDRFGARLRLVGIDPEADRDAMLARISDGDHELVSALRVLSDACEPIRFYGRLLPSELGADTFTQPADRNPPRVSYTADTPLNRLVDCTPPDSRAARLIRRDPGHAGLLAARWHAAAETIRSRGGSLALVRELLPLAEDLERLATVLEGWVKGRVPDGTGEILDAASAPCAELQLAVVAPLRRLVTGDA